MVKLLEEPGAPRNLLVNVTEALGNQGPRAKAAIPALLQLSLPPAAVFNARHAIHRIDPDATGLYGGDAPPRVNTYQ